MLFSKSDIKKLVIPLIIEQLLAVLVGMSDIMMVSSAGEAAVSGVSLVDLINVLINTIFAALGTGGAVVASQLLGARDEKKAKASANQLIYMAIVISLIITVIALLVRRGLLHLLFGSVDADVMQSALIYFTISAVSYPFIAVYNGGAALFRAMGNSKVSMIASTIMNLINIAGNAICVFGLHMGVAGVAVPSLVSRIFSAILMIVLLYNRKHVIHFEKLWRFKIDWRMMRRIVAIALPSSVENSMFQLGRLLLVSMISTFGTAQIAANAVANTLDGFGIIPGQAMGLALITVIGRCVGAEAWDQSRFYLKKMMKMTYVFMFITNGGLLIGLKWILLLYNLSAEAYWYALILVLIHGSCAMILWPISFTLPNALRAANDVRPTMIISIFSMMVFRLGFSYIFGVMMQLGIIGVWIAMVIDWLFRIACFLIRTRKIFWKSYPEDDSATPKMN